MQKPKDLKSMTDDEKIGYRSAIDDMIKYLKINNENRICFSCGIYLLDKLEKLRRRIK